MDARGVTLEAVEWVQIRNAVREERMYAVMRYILDRECSEETQNTIDYGE